MTDNAAATANTSEAKPTEAKPAAADPFAKLATAMYGKPDDKPTSDGKSAEGISKDQLTGKGEGVTPEARAALRDTIKAELAKIETIDQDHPVTAEFASLASDIGLDAEGAKKLVAFDDARRTKAWDDIGDSWLAEAERSPIFKADVELGNDLLRQYGSPELMADLEVYRLGNHPHLIQFLGRIGRAMRSARR
jgi:hypothetical protein